MILCADNDDHKPHSGTQKVITHAHKHFQNKGFLVTTVKPQTPGHDFNDVLKEKGVEEIRTYFKAFLQKSLSKTKERLESHEIHKNSTDRSSQSQSSVSGFGSKSIISEAEKAKTSQQVPPLLDESPLSQSSQEKPLTIREKLQQVRQRLLKRETISVDKSKGGRDIDWE